MKWIELLENVFLFFYYKMREFFKVSLEFLNNIIEGKIIKLCFEYDRILSYIFL